MRRSLLVFAALAVISSAVAFAQPVASTSSSDGLELLKRVAQQYSDAKSYYIASVEERTSTSEYSHSWQKTLLTAAEAPGNHYYYDGRSNSGHSVKIGDGKTGWTYRADEHRYTTKPQPIEVSIQQTPIEMTEWAMSQAGNLRKSLGSLAKSLKSADRLPDATLRVNGRNVSCYVIRVKSSDEKRALPSNSFDETIWINKTHETVMKAVEHTHTYLQSGSAHIPLEEEINTTFTTAELNGPVPESLFTFIPPSDAKHIQDFPDPRENLAGITMTGDQVPSLKLKSADGKVISLESFRGKPILLDFWATWCGPCVAGLPQLAQIYQEAKDKGLVLISVDQDEEAKTAADFWSKKEYAWPNFHDDGEIETLMGSSGIPRMVLIDAQGKIVYDKAGSSEEDLRTELAKLGPQYAPLSPKPKETHCIASK
jgi:thiol-disulfide isomerase/thioredoxin